jgi:hypothetical protein
MVDIAEVIEIEDDDAHPNEDTTRRNLRSRQTDR